MKSTPRTRKLGELAREALSEVLLTEVQDPRLEFVTVTSVEVSTDLRVADVYVTAHGDEARYAAALDGLRSADRRLRAGLGKRVVMRYVPELRYHIDTSVDEGMRIQAAIEAGPLRPPIDEE